MRRLLCCALALIFAQPSLGDRLAYSGRRDIVAHGSTVTVRHRHDWSRIPRHDGDWHLEYSSAQPFGVDLETSDLQFYSSDGALIARVPSPPLTYLEVSAAGRYVIGLSDIKFLNATQLVVFNQRGDLLLRRRISAEVYCFDSKAYQELKRKHSEAFQELESYVKAIHDSYGWRAGDKVYLDITGGLSEENGRALFSDIYPSRCRSSLSSHFSESVTNFVYWYDEADPRPHVVERDGQPFEIRLRDPEGTEFGVPFKLTPLEP